MQGPAVQQQGPNCAVLYAVMGEGVLRGSCAAVAVGQGEQVA